MNYDQFIEIKPLTKEFVINNISVIIELSQLIRNDYWVLDHYLADLDKKWELSSVAFYNDIICGFIIVSEKTESLHVNRIVISAQFQKKGIGKIFIIKAISDAKKMNKEYLTLKVDAANTGAINFYEKLNFELTGSQGELLLMRSKIAL